MVLYEAITGEIIIHAMRHGARDPGAMPGSRVKKSVCQLERPLMPKNVVYDPPFVHFEFLLILHAQMLMFLMDGAFVGPVIDSIEARVLKERAFGIVHRPQRFGVAHCFASAAVDRYFGELSEYDYFERHGFHNVFRLLDAVRRAWLTTSCGSKILARLSRQIKLLENEADSADLDAWSKIAVDKAVPLLEELATACRRSRTYHQMKDAYVAALADCLIHDRQICSHIAELLTWLAPKTSQGFTTQFVKRVKWPSYVNRIIMARDRGKCAYCHIDIAIELLAKPHIDHIVSQFAGGCNDIVNLQLCCEACNLEKSTRDLDVAHSIPKYLGNRYYV